MGRRDRLRKEAIRAGQTRPISAVKPHLMREVLKRATPIIFADDATDHMLVKDFDPVKRYVPVIMEVLPDALHALGENVFHVNDISKDKDWLEICYRNLAGLVSRMPTEVKHNNRMEWYQIKKRQGRNRLGEYKFCSWCGHPFYAPPSRKNQKWHTRQCFIDQRKWDKSRGQ